VTLQTTSKEASTSITRLHRSKVNYMKSKEKNTRAGTEEPGQVAPARLPPEDTTDEQMEIHRLRRELAKANQREANAPRQDWESLDAIDPWGQQRERDLEGPRSAEARQHQIHQVIVEAHRLACRLQALLAKEAR